MIQGSLNTLTTRTIRIDSRNVWNFDQAPHGLIAGVTGGGKTYFAAYLFGQLYLRGNVKVIDPKHSDLYQIGEMILGKKDSAYAPNQICRLLRETTIELDQRYDKLTNSHILGANYRSISLLPITIIFDEYAAFLSSIKNDKKLKTEADQYIRKIILTGRQAGVFIIIMMQKPNAEVIDTDIRDQLGLRATLGSMDDTGYRMVFGQHDNFHYEYRPTGSGYIYVPGSGYQVPQKMLAPKINLSELVERMKQKID